MSPETCPNHLLTAQQEESQPILAARSSRTRMGEPSLTNLLLPDAKKFWDRNFMPRQARFQASIRRKMLRMPVRFLSKILVIQAPTLPDMYITLFSSTQRVCHFGFCLHNQVWV